MKKLLFILIFLFLPFEVISTEKVLHCKIYFESEDSIAPLESKQNFYYREFQVFLDVKNKWLSMVGIGSQSYQLILPKMIDKNWFDTEFFYANTYTLQMDENKTMEYGFKLHKFSGFFEFTTQVIRKNPDGTGDFEQTISTGECEHIKKKKF